VDDEEDPSGRGETPAQRADRKFGDQLQELRVMQTGVQLLAGFLLTLPFQEEFEKLSEYQRDFYLCLVVLAGLTTALVLTPVSAHRIVSGRQVKDRLVEATGRIAKIALGGVALLVVGITTFIFDVVVDLTWSLLVGGFMGAVLLTLLVALPQLLIRRDA